MLGLKISASGLLLFLITLVLGQLTGKGSVNVRMALGLLVLFSLLAIFSGAFMAVWQ